jgi:hypothetical protein
MGISNLLPHNNLAGAIGDVDEDDDDDDGIHACMCLITYLC